MNECADGRLNKARPLWCFLGIRRWMTNILLCKTIGKLLMKEMYIKLTKCRRRMNHAAEFGGKVGKGRTFFLSMCAYNRYAVAECRRTLSRLAEQGISEVSVYGANGIAEILYDLSYEVPVTISAIYDECPRWTSWGPPVLPLTARQNAQELMILAAVIGVEEKKKRLSRLGINLENLVVMGR
jgi:hypothetical protein